MNRILATGTLTSTTTKLFACTGLQNADVRINYSNESTTLAISANMHVRGAQLNKRRLIAKDTVIPASGTLEEPGDAGTIGLGPGDELWGDASAAADYVVYGDLRP